MALVLDFRVGQRVFRVTRTRRRKGAGQAELEELVDGNECPLADGVREIDRQIQVLLGLPYEEDLDLSVDFTHRSEEHTSELQSRSDIVCRLLLEKKKTRFRSTPHAKTIRLAAPVVLTDDPTYNSVLFLVPRIPLDTRPPLVGHDVVRSTLRSHHH